MANPIIKSLRGLIKEIKSLSGFDKKMDEVKAEIKAKKECINNLMKQVAEYNREIIALELKHDGLEMQKRAVISNFNEGLGDLSLEDED